jgi:plastocyanin
MSRIVTRTATITAAGLCLLGTLAACSSSGKSPAAKPPAKSTPGKVIAATEAEYSIKLAATSVRPGQYTFKVKNDGTMTHSLTVNGPGATDEGTGDIDAGKTATVTVTLKAGTYDVFCPIGNHKAMGMDATLKVT